MVINSDLKQIISEGRRRKLLSSESPTIEEPEWNRRYWKITQHKHNKHENSNKGDEEI